MNDVATAPNDLALACAIGAAVRHSAVGAQLGVKDRDALTEAITKALLKPPGLAVFDRRLINHQAAWERARSLDTLLEAARLFNRQTEEHHIEQALDLATEQLCALRRELWGKDMSPTP